VGGTGGMVAVDGSAVTATATTAAGAKVTISVQCS
jgi:hypothetical protein